jgi:hypothetical protein
LEPEELFFTSSGRIGVIVNAASEISLHLTELQRNMAAVIPAVGGTSHARSVVFSPQFVQGLTSHADSEHRRVQEVTVMLIMRLLASSMAILWNSYSHFWTHKTRSGRFGTAQASQRSFQSQRTK